LIPHDETASSLIKGSFGKKAIFGHILLKLADFASSNGYTVNDNSIPFLIPRREPAPSNSSFPNSDRVLRVSLV
jgi:hypothetical protein